MKTLAQTLGFSLALILFFTFVTYTLPQMEGETPGETAVDLGALTMESFVAMGEDLYAGKGTCTLCHNALGRATDLLVLNAVQISQERLDDPRYQGDAKDAESYLRESMLDPGRYVVKGFGKKGSNDTESPMSAVDRPPIQLAEVEIEAIIAFLQAKDGNPVTVALPVEVPAVVEEKAIQDEPALAQTPEEVLTKFGCAVCHSILGSESPVGPDLNDVGAHLSVEQIRQSIITPNAVTAPGFPSIMPGPSDKMTVKELEMMVQFLATQKG